MRKKMLAALMCSMVFLAAGCENDEVMVLTPDGDAVIRDNGASAGNASKETEKTTEKTVKSTTEKNNSSSDLIHVGFAQVGSESDWRLAQTQSMKQTFTEAKGYAFDFVDCNNDQKTQLNAIQKFIDDGVDYIVLDPIVEEGYDDVLTNAKNANIPVIIVDRNISADESLYTCWVGSDFVKEGTSAADWLAEYLESNGRSSETINIVTIQGTLGASAQLGRTQGFHAALASHSNWVMLDEQSGDFTEEGGYAVMNAFIKQHPDIDVVICQNDNEAYGAIDAMKENNLTYGPDGDIIVISFDATNGGFQKMIDGEINVDIECNPLEGPLVSELIQKLEKGEAVDKIQYVDEGVYPAETAADIIDSRAY